MTLNCCSYSAGLATNDLAPTYPRVVQQVSLVPTLSLLMGVPIPFSNIGSVIPELFGTKELNALQVNVQQVHRYLSLYNKEFSNKFPHNMWLELLSIKDDIEALQKHVGKNVNDLQKIKAIVEKVRFDYSDSVNYDSNVMENNAFSRALKSLHVEYLTLAKAMCEEIWATFDVIEMVAGLMLMVVAVTNTFVIILSLTKHEYIQNYFIKGNVIMILIIITSMSLKYFIGAPVISFLPALFAGVVVVFHCSKISSLSLFAASKDKIPILIFTFVCLGTFSNSFVVHEDSLIAFFLTTLIVFGTLRVLFVHKNKTFENGRIVNLDKLSVVSSVIAIVLCVCSCISVRVGQSYYRCREEQHSCVPTNAFQQLSSLDHSHQNSRYFIGVLALTAIVYAPKTWLSHCGNLNGSRTAVFVARYCGVFSALMVAFHWAMEVVPKLTHTNYPPRIVFATALLLLIFIFWKPLMVFQQQQKQRNVSQFSNSKQVIPELFQNLKSEYAKNHKDGDTPVVFGLATGVSAPLVVVYSFLLVVMVLLVGDGLAPPALALPVTVICWLFLNSFTCWTNSALGQ